MVKAFLLAKNWTLVVFSIWAFRLASVELMFDSPARFTTSCAISSDDGGMGAAWDHDKYLCSFTIKALMTNKYSFSIKALMKIIILVKTNLMPMVMAG